MKQFYKIILLMLFGVAVLAQSVHAQTTAADTRASSRLAISPYAQAVPNIASGDGFQDATMLSFWGAVILESNTTGFAMEFIGDMHDSAAAGNLNSAEGIDVSGPAAP